MSKFSNLKKGLAVSAALVIGLTGAITAPAYAGTPLYGLADRTKVTLSPSTGVDWAVISGDAFSMESELPGNNVYTGGTLKWLLKGSTAVGNPIATPNGFTATEGPGLNVSLSSFTPGTADGFYDLTFDGSHNFGNGDTVTITGSETESVIGSFPDNTFDTVDGSGTGGVQGDADSAVDTRIMELPDFDGSYTVGVTAGVTLVNSNTLRVPVTLNSTTGPFETPAARFPSAYSQESFSQDFTGVVTRAASNTIAITAAAAGVVVDSRLNGSDNAVRSLVISSASNMTVEVTAWYDSNNNGLIDANEFASESETVRFVNAANVTAETFSFSRSGANFVALTKISPQLNSEQSSLTPRVRFRDVDTNLVGGFDDNNSATSVYSASTGIWTSTSGAIAETGYWEALPFLGTNGNLAAYGQQLRLAPVSLTVAATVAANLRATVTPSADVQAAVATQAAAGTAAVRLGTVSAPVTVRATSASGASIGAGKDIRVSWTGAYTVNGSTSPVTVQTDATGSATVTVAKTAPTVAGTVPLRFEITTSGAAVLATLLDMSWAAASYSLFNLTDTDETGIQSPMGIPAGGSQTYNLIYVDQWRVTAPAADFRLNVNISGPATTTGSQILAVAQTGTSLTVTSNGTVGTGTISVTISPERLSGGSWIASTATVVSLTVHRAVTSNVTITATAANRTADIQADTTVGAFDPRTQNALRPGYDGVGFYAVITGTITDSVSGLPVPNALVSLSGDSAFAFSTSQIDKLGSITVHANNVGQFEAWVYSNKSVFDSVVTVASGGASTTTNVTFLPADTSSGVEIKFVKVPKPNVKAGRTVDLSFTIVDAFGNNLLLAAGPFGLGEVYAYYEGPGFMTNQTSFNNGFSAANFDNGVISLKVVTGSGDFGEGNLTIVYRNDSTLLVDRKQSVKRASFEIGPRATAEAGAKKGRVIVEVVNAKGRTINVFQGSTRVDSFKARSSDVRYVVKGVKSGDRRINVRISGPGQDFNGRIDVR